MEVPLDPLIGLNSTTILLKKCHRLGQGRLVIQMSHVLILINANNK